MSVSNRKRSTTVLPLTPITPNTDFKSQNDHPKVTQQRNERGLGMSRVYSIPAAIVPQTLTHPDDDDINSKNLPKSPNETIPKWTQVGFQSIFQGTERSNPSLKSHHMIVPNADSDISRQRSPFASSSSHSNERLSRYNTRISESDEERLSTNDSIFTFDSSVKETKSNSLFNAARKESASFSEKTSRLFKNGSSHKNKKAIGNTNENNSSSSSINSKTSNGKPNSLSKVARKIFHGKTHRHIRKDENELAMPSSFSKFLHSSIGKHKSPVQFIHNTKGALVDSGKSGYSFNPGSMVNNTNDVSMSLDDEDSFDSANVTILHDFLKNLSSLESNYKLFNAQEVHILAGNIWSIYRNVVVELFKGRKLWHLEAKVEDIDRMLEFYLVLRTEIKNPSSHTRLLSEIEELITSSLFIFENQIVFNYNNESAMNSPLKRLGIIWRIFYEEVFYDVTACLLPLEKSFERNPKYWLDISSDIQSINHLLLKGFRDSIVLPYYQNFIHSHEGASKSFQMYIFSEEEESSISEQDKLTLLQCLGILGTIQGKDRNQIVIEELLEGVRMSI
ncbi:Bit2p NDAI_0B04750 [Naumovozyma dairenensis CBS 421]|uniref:Target of rapamycin complex 2 subunit BIT2 n=1 Tax=Naumovozyma dairenensis (strain ATCC 10597 / BCRC 20456 / CBS 421 / NBRC 0211 / NRRL Y-12639) TaxID=1071378 RepID=G0W6U8_NAUDC|nr:hypothetical protein NDAI_0B04750 [Naumovozyma dairenensis CBS 421]CCD23509.1 hypothetical protein NDAI_0B04750 [Naumovozyma dairenensis CBS 421]